MESTKILILEKAIELFKLWGYENTTIVMICDACEITKKTFYYHYSSKDDLIFEYYNSNSSNLSDILPEIIRMPSYKEKVWRLAEFFIDASERLGPELLQILLITDSRKNLKTFNPNRSAAEGDFAMISKLQVEYTKLARECGELRTDTDAETLIWLFNTSVLGITLDWSSRYGSFDMKAAIRKSLDIIFITAEEGNA